MVAERTMIDIDENPDLIRLVDRVLESHISTVLRRNGQEVAIISPVRRRRQKSRALTQEDIDAFAAAAGGWKGLVDGDKLLAEIYADRDLETREFGDW